MYKYHAKVSRIIDGDSIVLDIDLGFNTWLNNQSIRLYGIDTPETRTRDLTEKAQGNLAKDRVKELIAPGDYVTIQTTIDKREKFGRILGSIITNDGINVNLLLIEERLAVKYHGQSKDKVKAEHLQNQIYLIQEGKITPHESK